jgi:hypothetical protein
MLPELRFLMRISNGRRRLSIWKLAASAVHSLSIRTPSRQAGCALTLVLPATPSPGRSGRVFARLVSLALLLPLADVSPGDRVVRGQPIGTIGTAGGRYLAHLHLELRDPIARPLGAGYGEPDGHLDPTAFIRAHRPR